MAKIKLTEGQIAMLQNLESQLPKKKTVKITAEQYTRLFEGDGSYEFKGQVGAMKPASQLTRDFRQQGKDIPDSNMRFEGANAPQVDIMDFGQEIINFLKRLLTDPEDDSSNKFWNNLGVSKQELMDKMFELNMLGRKIANGRKMLAIMKDGFVDNIKKLYDDIVPKNEGMVQFGDDIEMTEINNSDDIVNSFKQQVGPNQKTTNPKPSPEDVKAKLAQVRAAELERRKREEERPIGEEDEMMSQGEQIVGANILNHFPFTDLPEDRSEGYSKDVKGWGTVYLPSIDGEDSQTQIPTRKDVAGIYNWSHEFKGKVHSGQRIGWIDQFIEKYGEQPVFVMNPEAPWHSKIKVINPKFIERRKQYSDTKGSMLKSWGTTESDEMEETTTASSSGAFVAPLTNAPISRGLSPQKAMGDLEETDDNGGLKKVQLTQQDIWNAMRGNVEKDKKKHKAKLGHRKAKHKGQRFDEYDISADETEAITTLKHNYFSHPALGEFRILDVRGKRENDDQISYIIALKNGDNKLIDSNLLYTYNKKTGEEKLMFNHDYEKLYDAYKIFDKVYSTIFDEIRTTLRPRDIQEQGIGSTGQYATPGFPASDFFGNKGKKGKAPVNKGITHQKTMYPKGKMVKMTESQYKMLQTLSEGDNQTKTAYPDGGFVEFDDCTKLNNNKVAQNGGCSTGAVDNVVKVKKTKESVISKEALYYEVAQKTGKTVEEVKNIIESKKA